MSENQNEGAQQGGPANQNPIEVDPNDDDELDSTFGDSSSDTTSLASTVLNYQYENGRRYHGYMEGRYIMPNDEQEKDRLDIFHHLMGLMLGGRLHLAPIGPQPQRILDIATGTGAFAIDIGDQYPSAQVIGTDLSPIQPSMVPPNVQFEIDDIENNWTYSPFDFIHCRYMVTSIKDWPRLFRQAYEHTKPGGWVEFKDWDTNLHCDDGTMKPDGYLARWTRDGIDAVKRIGREYATGPKLKGWMEDAGFVNVHEEVFKLPLGPWPKDEKLKEIGTWNLLQMHEGTEALSIALFTRSLGWSFEEVQVLLAGVRAEMKDRRIHAYYNFYVTYGQKPEEPKSTSSDVNTSDA